MIILGLLATSHSLTYISAAKIHIYNEIGLQFGAVPAIDKQGFSSGAFQMSTHYYHL